MLIGDCRFPVAAIETHEFTFINPSNEPMRTRVKLAPILIAAAFGLAVSTPSLAQDVPRPVRLITLHEAAGAVQRSFSGRVRALQSVDLAFQVSGQILEFPVVQGELVEQGQMVARLDLSSFERQVREAETSLERSRRNLERVERLASSVPRSEVADLRDASVLAEIALENATAALDHATLVAPFDARVARREVANFTTVSAGQPVLRLHDVSALLVDILLPEAIVRASEAGELSFSAMFTGSDVQHVLDIEEFEADTREAAQSFVLTLRFREHPGMQIVPGQSATVRIRQERPRDAGLPVPESALVFSPDRTPQVFVYQPDAASGGARGRVALRAVEIAVGDDGRTRVVAGLAPGDVIVASGGAQLRDGTVVRPFMGMGQ